MKKFLEKKYINSGFVIALIILISVNIVIYINLRFHFEDETIIKNSLTIIQVSEALYSNIIEAESDLRGYTITNNEVYYREIKPALYSVDSSFQILNSIIQDSSERIFT